MELRKIFRLIKNNSKILFVTTFICIVASVLYFYSPTKYISEGSFYISREIEKENNEYFKYEGYYNQQTAQSYTDTVAALIESVSVRSEVLNILNIEINEENLRKYGKIIDVKKTGPQILTLTTKGNTKTESLNIWNALSVILIEKNIKINENGDSNLNIVEISNTPIVKESYRSIPVFLSVGIITGVSLGLLYISIREYL